MKRNKIGKVWNSAKRLLEKSLRHVAMVVEVLDDNKPIKSLFSFLHWSVSGYTYH